MSSAVLEISDLVHRFGERVAVDHLTVGIGEREIVGLVGRNGAGKTTTMRPVMGIVRPTGGEVRWEGRPVRQADRLREQASYWIARLGLGPRQHERVVALSHGNQQRVQLAVALVSDPDLLVLDALGVVSPWEVLAAILVMLAAIYGVSRLVSRIYAAALVRGGARLSWGAALRLREF